MRKKTFPKREPQKRPLKRGSSLKKFPSITRRRSIRNLFPSDAISQIQDAMWPYIHYSMPKMQKGVGAYMHFSMMRDCRVFMDSLGPWTADREREMISKLDKLYEKEFKAGNFSKSHEWWHVSRQHSRLFAIEVIKAYGVSQSEINILQRFDPRTLGWVHCELNLPVSEVQSRYLELKDRVADPQESESLKDAYTRALAAVQSEVIDDELKKHGKKKEDYERWRDLYPKFVQWVSNFPSIPSYIKFMRETFIPIHNAGNFHRRRCIECGQEFFVTDKRSQRSKFCFDDCAARARARGRDRIANGRSTAENAAKKIAVQFERHLSKCRICEKEGMCTTANKLLAADDVARRRLSSLEDWQLNEPVEEDES